MSVKLPRNLRIGMSGEDVRLLQNALIRLGYAPGKPDGVFGPKTQSAVQAFQRNWSLVQDGIVGPVTAATIRRALTEPVVLNLGSRGPEVAKIQSVLKQLGYDPGPIDGVYGPKTKEAVTRFQKDAGLTPDGITGSATLTALNNALQR